MMHKAWCSIEEVPYYFPRSSIKLQGHKGWIIKDFNPIWVRLLAWSQLSDPSDLPCFPKKTYLKVPSTKCWSFCAALLVFKTMFSLFAVIRLAGVVLTSWTQHAHWTVSSYLHLNVETPLSSVCASQTLQFKEITGNASSLIHCGLVMPYGDIDLGQHWLR